ncbi:hypothetical protein GCM10023162_03020 [Klenkia terrae]
MSRRTWGTVRRLRSGRYQARYTDDTGRQVSAPSTFATKADGYRWLAKTQTELDSGRWIDPKAGKEPLQVYAEHWVETRLVRGRPLAPRTAELYRAQLKNHIVPSLGSTPLRQLEASSVRAWYGKLSGPAGPGQVTAAKCYRLLRAICTTAVDDNLIARNPCSIRGAGQERSSERPMFTLAQVQALVDAVEDRWRALILLAAWTGLRIGELSALRREHLDLKAGTVSVEPWRSRRTSSATWNTTSRRTPSPVRTDWSSWGRRAGLYDATTSPRGCGLQQQRRPDCRLAPIYMTCAAGAPPSPPGTAPPPGN